MVHNKTLRPFIPCLRDLREICGGGGGAERDRQTDRETDREMGGGGGGAETERERATNRQTDRRAYRQRQRVREDREI